MNQALGVILSSESNEWYTPAWIADIACKVMGSIDLDPASCEIANELILAKQFFTKKDDGLAQPWGGNIWCNPPRGKTGSKSNQELWAEKMIYEYGLGRITQGHLLTRTVPGYGWWESLFREWPVCFLRERVKFFRVDDGVLTNKNGQTKAGASIWYFGPYHRWDIFREKWAMHGKVIYPK